MKGKWSAWWNGVFTIIWLALAGLLFHAVWAHNGENIFEFAFLLFMNTAAWVGTFLEAIG